MKVFLLQRKRLTALACALAAAAMFYVVNYPAAVSAYATDAMRWAVASGLIQGSNSKLNPKGTATRAQVATILMRVMQKFAK